VAVLELDVPPVAVLELDVPPVAVLELDVPPVVVLELDVPPVAVLELDVPPVVALTLSLTASFEPLQAIANSNEIRMRRMRMVSKKVYYLDGGAATRLPLVFAGPGRAFL
jgi:hypothetical protein